MYESIDHVNARLAVDRGFDVYEVRAGIRYIGLYTDYNVAMQIAEFYGATVFDFATKELV